MPEALARPVLLVALTDIFPNWASAVPGLALVFLTNAGCTSAKSIKKLLRNQVHYSQVLEGKQCSRGPHSKFRGEGREMGPALLLLGPRGRVSRVL